MMNRKEKERRKELKELEKYQLITDLRMTNLMVKEMELETKIRRKAMSMARKRRLEYIT